MFIFFFQAEDGIRDGHVTGVQTCALPILDWAEGFWPILLSVPLSKRWIFSLCRLRSTIEITIMAMPWARSEERRVGKECGSRLSPDHLRRNRQRQRRVQEADI